MKLKWVRYLVERPTIMWSVLVAMTLLGILSFVQMPKLEDPAITIKQAMVVIARPGATVHEMELQVVEPVEEALRTLPDVRKIKADIQPGMAQFTVEFYMHVPVEEIEQYFDLIRRKINDIQGKLPPGCVASMVIDDQMDVYGLFYALQGEGYSYDELYDYAKYIRNQLLSLKGVKRVSILGMREETLNIVLNKGDVTTNGMLPTQIMLALQELDSPVQAGVMDAGLDTDSPRRVTVKVDTMVCTVDDIKNLYLPTLNGKRVRLGDIAKVERAYKEPWTNGFFVNGEPALGIAISLQKGVVVPDVGKEVDAKLSEALQTLPVGLTTEKIFFQPDKVDEAINSFLINLVESVLIVIILLMVSMGWRSGMIIGIGLILTILLSFPILQTLGTTLQRISLGAFIVAMGMLVDNAIVIMDGILKDRARGLNKDVYLFRTGDITAMPLLGATIIAATTFIAIFLSEGSVAEYANDLFLVLSVSLLVSWVLALVQVPFFAGYLFKKDTHPVKVDADGDNLYKGLLYRIMSKCAEWCTAHTVTTVIIAVVVLGISGWGLTKVKNVFFPDFNYKQFVVEYQLPPQASPEQLRKDLLEISDSLMRNPDIERVAAISGGMTVRYCLVRPMNHGGETYGELMVDCPDFETVRKVTPWVRRYIREQYPDAYSRIRMYNFSISTSHTVECGFSGPDPKVLRELADSAMAIMRASKYIDPYSVQTNWKPRVSNVVYDYYGADGAASGIKRSDIGTALSAASDGSTIGIMADNEKRLLINLQVRNADGSKITDPNEIPVWNLTGTTSTVGSVVRGRKLQAEEASMYRLDGQRQIEVECDPDPYLDEATTAKALESIQKKIEDIPLPHGYSLKWIGEQEVQNEAMGSMYQYIPLMMLILLAVLLMLFGKWKQVIVILMCMPFALCGIVPALLLTNTPFTFMAIIGAMGLMGMMTKNAIVLIDEADRLIREQHVSVVQAARMAAVSRVRPVLLASMTTILGMLPLITDPMYGSMAVVIMGGLFMGTLITLLLLPTFYVMLIRKKHPVTPATFNASPSASPNDNTAKDNLLTDNSSND